MKIKNTILYLLFLILSSSLWGQDKNKKMSYERLKSLKINFILEQLDLTTEQETFVWRAFDQYETDMRKKYYKKMKGIRHNTFKKIDELTEAEASEVIDSINYFKSQKEVLYKKFNDTLETKLTSKQVLRIHIAEEKFHRKMVHGSRNKKNIP